MFPSTYFPTGYFAPRYWPPGVETVDLPNSGTVFQNSHRHQVAEGGRVMSGDSRPAGTHELKVGEESLVYCANFSNEPAVTGGATIDSVVSVTVQNGKVTVADSSVIVAEFVQYDDDEVTPLFTVPAGKGIKFAVTAASKGQCKVSVKAACSDGQKPIVDVLFVVK